MDCAIDIKHYLPHRPPMLMVDMIHRMDEQVVETSFEIKPDNIFAAGGVFAEAGLIENAAQTCSSIVAKGYFVDEHNQDKPDVDVIGFISAIKSMKVHALPKTGSTITTKAVLVSKFVTETYSLCTMDCKTFDGEILLLDGEINLFIQEQSREMAAKSEVSGQA